MTGDRQSRDDQSPLYGSLAEGGQFYRRAGARLSEPQDQSVVDLFDADDEPHEHYHAFDTAHAVMLTEEGIIPAAAGRAILRGLREMESDGVVGVREEIGRSKHSGEAYLIRELGEDVGGWLHVARSSHDLGSVAERMALRESLLDATESLLDLANTYADRAAEHLETVLPTYTGIQHAQVATVGFYLTSFERPVERDVQRLLGAYERVNRSPAGAAVGTTSDFPIDRERVADLLGFDGILDNGEDVDKSVDVALEVGSAFAIALANLGVAADQFLLWNSAEFDLVDFPDRFCGTSSIMPQKKNPHAIESVKRRSNAITGEVVEQFLAASSMGGSVGLSAGTLESAIGNFETWESLVRTVSFDADRGEGLVYADWALATDLAGALVRQREISWRTAHQIVAVLVRQAEEDGRSVLDLTPADVDRAAREYTGEPVDLSRNDLERVLDAKRSIQSREDVPGSPAPAQVSNQIDAAREFVAETRPTVSRRRDRLRAAERRLETAVDSLLDD